MRPMSGPAALDTAHTYPQQPPQYSRIRVYPAATDRPDLAPR